MSPARNPVVVARGLSKFYEAPSMPPRCAVDDVAITIGEGEFILIKGPSGSGKTTLLSMMGCLMRPTAGTISIGGTDVTGMDQGRLTRFRLEHIGFVFQGFRLVEYLTVLENVLLPLALMGNGRTQAVERAERLLSGVGLSGRSQSPARELSGGEQQRVAVARALANDPLLILADEPTGSLDSAGGRGVIRLLSDLTAGGRTTVVVVSHDERIVPHADRVLAMEDGRIS